MDKGLDSPWTEALGYAFVETIDEPTLNHGTSKEVEWIVERFQREIEIDQLDDLFQVLQRRVNDCVRTRIKCVCGLACAALFEGDTVVLCHDAYDRATDVVHIKKGWVGVERDSVELIRVFHRDGCKCVKVTVSDGFDDVVHPIGDDGEALWEESRGLDGALHVRVLSGGSALVVIGDDTDEGVHVGPVSLGCDLFGERVGAVISGAFLPCDEPAKEGTACRTGTLTSNEGEFFERCRKLVQPCEGIDKGCKT